jgi:hypothetical protein
LFLRRAWWRQHDRTIGKVGDGANFVKRLSAKLGRNVHRECRALSCLRVDPAEADMPNDVLLTVLSDRSRFKLSLEIELDEDSCIRARHYSFDGNYAFGCTIHHEGQRIDRGINWPTEQEYYGIELPDRENVPYEELKSIVIEAKQDDPDDLPWIEYQNGNPTKESETTETLLEWLRRPVEDERLEDWGDSRISEYGIGIEIFDALSDEDRAHVGLALEDFGFVSSVVRARLDGSLEAFNLLMQQKNLQVVLVHDAV